MEDLTPIASPGLERPDRSAPGNLRRGAMMGRYVVLDRIGAGGMGAVYAAYDPRLDRRIALKVLHQELGGSSNIAQARLLREAQAMASLSHPNVITVHDVGVDCGQVFVAMELIDGQTLSEWLRADEPDPSEVLRAYTNAGRGLAAAHAVAVVHRDFKPDNVMVAADGRILVMDFGLAREANKTDPPSDTTVDQRTETSPGSGALTLTLTGALVGTPAYMSPEQLRARPVDARSDQFAYCVALWEALFGSRPYAGESVADVRRKVLGGLLSEPPSGHRVPALILAALRRGLSFEPSDRFPTMDSLLETLEQRPPNRRRHAILGGVAVAGLLGVAGASLDETAAPACDASEQHVAQIWDDARIGVLAASFESSGAPVADARWATTRAGVQAWLVQWSQTHVAVCEATHVHQEQTPTALERRMDCLHDAMLQVDATLTELATPDADLVLRAPAVIGGLPDPLACRTLEVSTPAPGPQTPTQRAAFDRARVSRATAAAMQEAGRYPGTLEASDEGLTALVGVNAPALRCDLLGHRASALRQLGRVEEALATLDEGLALAQSAELADAEASLWLILIEATGVAQAQTREALALLLPAQLAITRAHAPALRIGLEDLAGRILVEDGQVEAAVSRFTTALAIIESEGARPGVAANVHNDLGVTLSRLARYDEALIHHRRAAAVTSQAWGPDHPFVATSLMNTGLVLEAQGNLDAAREHLREALSLRESLRGTEHPEVAEVLSNLGTLAGDHGDLDEGRELLERALAIFERTLPEGHPRLGITLDNLAIIAKADGRLDDALVACEAALAILGKRLDTRHPDVLMTQTTRASILAELGRHAEAIEIYRGVIEIHEQDAGPNFVALASPLIGLAQSTSAVGDHASAIAAATRALSVLVDGDAEPRSIASAEFNLASVRMAEGTEPAAAVGLAKQARDRVANESSTPDRHLAAEIDAWLSAPTADRPMRR